MQLFDAKKIKLQLSDLLILSSYPFSSALTQTTLLGDIMDYGLLGLIMAFIGLFTVVCGIFWLIIFFAALGHFLSDVGGHALMMLMILIFLLILNRRKSYIDRHAEIRKNAEKKPIHLNHKSNARR